VGFFRVPPRKIDVPFLSHLNCFEIWRSLHADVYLTRNGVKFEKRKKNSPKVPANFLCVHSLTFQLFFLETSKNITLKFIDVFQNLHFLCGIHRVFHPSVGEAVSTIVHFTLKFLPAKQNATSQFRKYLVV
jgi:hypothetical protein